MGLFDGLSDFFGNDGLGKIAGIAGDAQDIYGAIKSFGPQGGPNPYAPPPLLPAPKIVAASDAPSSVAGPLLLVGAAGLVVFLLARRG